MLKRTVRLLAEIKGESWANKANVWPMIKPLDPTFDTKDRAGSVIYPLVQQCPTELKAGPTETRSRECCSQCSESAQPEHYSIDGDCISSFVVRPIARDWASSDLPIASRRCWPGSGSCRQQNEWPSSVMSSEPLPDAVIKSDETSQWTNALLKRSGPVSGVLFRRRPQVAGTRTRAAAAADHVACCRSDVDIAWHAAGGVRHANERIAEPCLQPALASRR